MCLWLLIFELQKKKKINFTQFIQAKCLLQKVILKKIKIK